MSPIKQINQARKDIGMTQRSLARELGKDEAEISRLLRGKYPCAWTTLQAMAKAVGLELQAIPPADGPQDTEGTTDA